MTDIRLLALNTPEINSIPSASNKIIAIEGMPGSGKTTILTSLSEQLEGTCILLSELNLEPDSPEKKLPAQEQGDIFHALWLERIALLNTFQNPKPCFLLDRTYFSNLAYTYALDFINGTQYYPIYKQTFYKGFENFKLDLILIYDLPPEIGLERRALRGDIIPWPWSNIAFLTALRKFYKEELPAYSQENIRYINANREKSIVMEEVMFETLKFVDKQETYSNPHSALDKEKREALYNFAESHKLGQPITRIISVLGIPTVYFLKHSVQLEQDQPVFFNNKQLHRISHRYNSIHKTCDE